MNNINLLPPIQKQKRLALSLVAYITIGFFVLLISMAGFALTLTTIQFTTSDRIGQYDNQIGTLQRQIKSYNSLEADVSKINQGLQSVNTTLALQLQPNHIIDAISSKINPNVIMTGLALDHKDSASGVITVSITGNAKDRASIIEFKRSLESVATMQNLTYTFTATGTGSTGQVNSALPFSYTIAANYQLESKP